DLRYTPTGWETYQFVGSKWQNINKPENKQYLKNAYRVLLTRARQGMIIVVPGGDAEDPTRKSAYYEGTYNYLKGLGFDVIT
ncbi:MAG TPA: DNA/RNA helicase domain-containing protein, partial [Aquella sp.]|nr:DNA/RNA helicase domain-containing protein [Aquella sp.]